MAKRINEMKALVVLFIMVLVSNLFTACDNELTDAQAPKTFTETVKKEQPKDTVPPTPEEDWYLLRDSVNNGHEYSFTITGGERTSGATAISRGNATMEENDKYTIEERYRNLDLAYANTHKTLGQPETKMGRGALDVITLATFGLEDGNIVKVTSNISHAVAKVEGKERFFPCDSLKDVRLISVSNVERAATRAAAEYISDSVYTEIKAELTYVTTGLKNNYSYTQVIGDTITRYILSKNDVDTIYAENKQRTVLTATTEQCSFDKVVVFKNGESQKLSKSIILQYGVENIPEYEKEVKDFGYNFISTNGVSKGETKIDRLEERWTVSRRTDVYSSNFSNPYNEGIQTNYTLFHESAIYDDGDVKVEFPMLDMNVAEVSTKVTNIASTKGEWYEMARLDNEISVDYQGFGQNSAEDVILFKENAHVVSEGWDDTTAKKTITLWNVHTEIDYVIVYSDGSEDRTSYSMDFGWSFGPKSKWSVVAENNSYYTGNVVANVNGSQKTKAAKDGATWGWMENTHSLIADVIVANGTQKDEWAATTVNDITIERNGNVYNFGHDDYNMTDGGAKLGNATSTDSEDVYPYTHSLTFGMGGVTDTKAVSGEIHVEKVIIPDTFFGSKVLSVSQIVCNNQNRSDYMYSVLAHLENGQVVPGIWNKNGNIEFHLEWAVKAESDNLNGAAYESTSNTWVPVHAWDSPDMLQYDSQSGSNVDNQGYLTAMQWNWDEGKLVDGHASVTTNRFSFNIENGVLSATDTYTGSSIGSWTYTK